MQLRVGEALKEGKLCTRKVRTVILPAPEPSAKYEFAGHKLVFEAGNIKNLALASMAAGASNWHFNARGRLCTGTCPALLRMRSPSAFASSPLMELQALCKGRALTPCQVRVHAVMPKAVL